MEKETLYKLIEDPALIDRHRVDMLNKLIEQYPYFYGARLYHLIGLKNLESDLFQEELKKVSALSPNRHQLFLTLNPPVQQKPVEEPTTPTPETTEDEVEPNVPLFQIDDSQDQGVEVVTEIVPEKIDTEETIATEGVLLELGDPKAPRTPKTDEELYVNPLLYTLEVPEGFVETDPLAAVGFGRFNREDRETSEGMVESHKVQSTEEETSQEQTLLNQSTLIDRFIEADPRILPKDRIEDLPREQIDISLESIKESEDNISELLAEIFYAQGHYKRAIAIYDKLSLKFPDKSAYFAIQIKKIKDQLG